MIMTAFCLRAWIKCRAVVYTNGNRPLCIESAHRSAQIPQQIAPEGTGSVSGIRGAGKPMKNRTGACRYSACPGPVVGSENVGCNAALDLGTVDQIHHQEKQGAPRVAQKPSVKDRAAQDGRNGIQFFVDHPVALRDFFSCEVGGIED